MLQTKIQTEISFKFFLFLFLLKPCHDFLYFTLNRYIVAIPAHGAYLLLFMFLVMIFKDREHKFGYIFLLAWFSLYSTLFPGNLNNNAREAAAFILACGTFYFLSNINISATGYRYHDRFFLIFTVVFLSGFMFMAHSMGYLYTHFGELGLERRVYRSFILPHSFGYYMAILGYYIALSYSLAIALPIFAAGLVTGVRSSFLVIGLAVVFSFIESREDAWKKIYKMSFLIVFSLMVICSLKTFFGPAEVALYTIKMMVNSFFYILISDPTYIDVTDLRSLSMGRTLLWQAGIEEIINNAGDFIIGQGPLAPGEFIRSLIGVAEWFHSDFIQITFSFGFVGLLVYFFFLYLFVRRTNSFFATCFIITSGALNGFYKYDVVQLCLVIKVLHDLQQLGSERCVRNKAEIKAQCLPS